MHRDAFRRKLGNTNSKLSVHVFRKVKTFSKHKSLDTLSDLHTPKLRACVMKDHRESEKEGNVLTSGLVHLSGYNKEATTTSFRNMCLVCSHVKIHAGETSNCCAVFSAWIHGDPRKVVYPTDSHGQFCGHQNTPNA